jgi:fatty-acyl-CoA synthase
VFSERLKAVLTLKPGHVAGPQEIREHCARHLAPYEVPEYVVFAQAIPANPAGKTLKPPLVDFWGDGLETALDKLKACCDSMPQALLRVGHFRLEGEELTPETALRALAAGDALGRRIASTIDRGGVVALTRPDEARFRGGRT